MEIMAPTKATWFSQQLLPFVLHIRCLVDQSLSLAWKAPGLTSA